MSTFYTKVFGWKTKQLGEEMGNYVLVGTTECDEKTGMPKKPGAINGGFYQKNDAQPYPSIVISVDNLKESIQKVKAAGGKILGEQMDIPGVGLFTSIVDTEGNQVGMLQPHRMK